MARARAHYSLDIREGRADLDSWGSGVGVEVDSAIDRPGAPGAARIAPAGSR